MRALVSPKYGLPSEYAIHDYPKPEITRPDDILIKVHAASVNPVDVKGASGAMKFFQKAELPYRLGYDLSGVVEEVGSGVPLHLKPGTEVYALVSDEYRGCISEYCVVPTHSAAVKPGTLSHTEAASVPLTFLTALQALQRASNSLDGGLQGKTVFVPGGLSGVGAATVQLAKNVFHVGHVITTLSSDKALKVKDLLGEGIVDQVIDYTKQDPGTVITPSSIDFMFDTMNQATTSLGLMKQNSIIVSVSGIPFGEDVKRAVPNMPNLVNKGLDAYGSYLKWKTGRAGVKYEHLMVNQEAGDLERLRGWLDEGLLRPLVGRVARLDDLDDVRNGCEAVYAGKGTVGKFVIEI